MNSAPPAPADLTTAGPKLSELGDFEQALGACYGRFDVDRIADAAFSGGAVRRSNFGPLGGVHVDMVGATTARRKLPSQWHDRSFLLMPYRGTLTIEHYDRAETIRAGDICCIDSRVGAELGAIGPCSTLAFEVDRRRLGSEVGSLEQLFGARIDGSKGVGRLLSGMLHTIADDTASSYENGENVLIEAIIAELLGHIVKASDPLQGEAPGLLRRMRKWVADNAGDRTAGPSDMAAAFGLSRSALYRLFAQHGTTPGRWLWEERLDLARERLDDRDHRHLSICEISYSAGFNDSSHFSRAFKQRFGMSPRLARKV